METIKEIFLNLSKSEVFTIIGWLGFIVSGIWLFYTKKEEIKLKTELDILKSKEILNDEKVRKSYKKFIDLFFKVMKQKATSKEIEDGMVDFMKNGLLFASSNTIKSFSNYRKNSKNPKKLLKVLAELILSMRKDLGVSNNNIDYKDILQVFIIDDVDEALKKVK